MKDEALAVLAQTWALSFPSPCSLPQGHCWSWWLRGHCEHHAATANGLPVSHHMSEVSDTIYSEQGVSCRSDANFGPCWGKLGILNPSTSRELCGSLCQPFPGRRTSCWPCPSDAAWLVSPGLQPCSRSEPEQQLAQVTGVCHSHHRAHSLSAVLHQPTVCNPAMILW